MRLSKDQACGTLTDLIKANGRPEIENGPKSGQGLHLRQVDTYAGMRSLGEGEMCSGIGTANVKTVGIGKSLGIAIGRGKRNNYQVTLSDRCASQVNILGGVSIDAGGGRFQAKRFFDCLPAQRPIISNHLQLLGIGEQMPEKARGHSLACLDSTKHHHRSIRNHFVRRKCASRPGEYARSALRTQSNMMSKLCDCLQSPSRGRLASR
jgi:hypothetical protein